MTSSIQLLRSQHLSLEFSENQQKVSNNTVNSSTEITSNSSKITAVKNLSFSNRVSTLNPQEIKQLYNQIKKESREDLESNNYQNKELRTYDYLGNTIEEIVNHPIEVKIERDEMNLAILYGTMGISLLDIKRIEVRMELLTLAKDDVSEMAQDGFITKDEEITLNKNISKHMDSLIAEKEELLDRKQIKENEALLLEQLTRSSFN